MTPIRWSDHDHYFGPFTYATDKHRDFAIVLGSGDNEDYPGCRLRVAILGHTLIAKLPAILLPWRQKCYYTSAPMIHNATKQWYWDVHERQYGFSYGCDGVGPGGFLQIFPWSTDTRQSNLEELVMLHAME